jgi:hypothetical protein
VQRKYIILSYNGEAGDSLLGRQKSESLFFAGNDAFSKGKNFIKIKEIMHGFCYIKHP